MSAVRPLVIIDGRVRMLPAGDSLDWSWLSGIPAPLASIVNLAPVDGEILEFDSSTNGWDATKEPRDLYIDGGSF